MGAPMHGFNALIYIGATALVGGNAWGIDIGTDSAETPQFGDTWKKQVLGMKNWSGSLTAWEQGDAKLLSDAAVAATVTALKIYPNRSDATDYYSGNAIFSFGSSGDTGSAVSNTASFTGDDTLAITGFTP